MATFVLVHGAWHGGWCWKQVAALLRQAGHEVFMPTLSVLGLRETQECWDSFRAIHMVTIRPPAFA
jgi:hypothetical protein